MKKNFLSWYSELYLYALGLAALESMTCVYALSTGNLLINGKIAFVLWFILMVIGASSLMCKKKLENMKES